MLPFIIGSSAGMLLAGVSPAFCLLGAGCDWLVVVKKADDKDLFNG
jgi:hypothetical protein